MVGMWDTIGIGKAAKIALTGLEPRSAENKAAVGGRLLIIGAKALAPILFSEEDMASGNLCVNPTMIMVKNIPILAINAVLIMVVIIPEATPLSCAGTEFIMAVWFGGLNIPSPAPIRNSANSKFHVIEIIGNICQYQECYCRNNHSKCSYSTRPVFIG